MDYDHLMADLKSGVLEVYFQKLDGSMRKMRCTLARTLIPETHRNDSAKSLTLDEMTIQYGDDVERWIAAGERGDLNPYPFSDILRAVFSVNKREKTELEKALIKVFDIDAKDWRSFYVHQVISAQYLDTI
jgi:hypothetical protein